jgi:3-dehydroquinate dehydratase-1
MTTGRAVKGRMTRGSLVAVIASVADLHRASRLRQRPDFFELRLDAFDPLSPEIEHAISKLSQPLIATARHPGEGGYNNLTARQRRRLLLHYLPRAAWVDVELRSAVHLRSVLEVAKESGVRRIISLHDLQRTPTLRELTRVLERAQRLSADVLKIVTRTETPADLVRLLAFFEEHKGDLPISAMGVGKLGRESRVALLERGSVLNYVQLGTRMIEGQFTFRELERWASGL